MKRIILALVSTVVFTTGGLAQAQARGVHAHDGFALQLDAGFGALASKASSGGTSLDLSGGAGEFSIMLGGVVAPDFIIGGQLWGVSASSPKLELNGQDLGSSDSTLSLSGVGVNFTYYFMPVNVYVSATPSIGTLSVKSGGTTSSTKNGFALRLAAGKEWWVSDNWGIGLNLQYAHSSNEDNDQAGAPTWGSNFFGVAFSATYN